jgi:CarD family transcriptional regulator
MPMTLPMLPIKLKVGDKAVHMGQGVGEVVCIERRDIAGVPTEFYVLKILHNNAKVMVPVGSTSQLRAVMTSKEADCVLDTMRAREVAVDLQPWSRRFRAYTEMIKTGEPHEIAKVLRDMYRLKFDKDLSFGERRLLDQAKSILIRELALAKRMNEDEILAEVSGIFTV